MIPILRAIFRPGLLLLLAASALLVLHFRQSPNVLSGLKAETLYDFTLSITFDGRDADLNISTFLPRSDERQEIVRETVRSAQMQFDDRSDSSGRLGSWTGSQSSEIRYHGLIALNALSYELDPTLALPAYEAENQIYLEATSGIQVDHEEIAQLWAEDCTGPDQLFAAGPDLHLQLYIQ